MGWWAHSSGQRMAITGKRSQEHRGLEGGDSALFPSPEHLGILSSPRETGLDRGGGGN